MDPDHGNVSIAHPDKASFMKKRESNTFMLFGVLDNCDDEMEDEVQCEQCEEWICDLAIKDISAQYGCILRRVWCV